MAIVTRNGRNYSYQSIRINGKVTSRYQGSGELAELAEVLNGCDRAERMAERMKAKAERDTIRDGERPIEDYFDYVEEQAVAALTSLGFYRHHREWRKRRGTK